MTTDPQPDAGTWEPVQAQHLAHGDLVRRPGAEDRRVWDVELGGVYDPYVTVIWDTPAKPSESIGKHTKVEVWEPETERPQADRPPLPQRDPGR